VAARCRAEHTVPLLRDAQGLPLKRNFVHVDDLVAAILAALDNPATKGRLYNVAMDEPVDYGAVASHLQRSRGLSSIDIPSQYHSTWLDNSRAKLELDWRPRYDLERLIDTAWNYRRAAGDPRKVCYPG
jgi:nucleoside-diphosphate-sugar epimerase